MCVTREALDQIRPQLSRLDPRSALLAGASLIGLAAALYLPPVYALLGETAVTTIFNLIQVFSALTLVSLVIGVWWSSEPGETLRAIAGCLALGLTLWAAGQAVYAFFQVERGPDFVGPTPADALWLAGYVPMIAGLYLRLHTFSLNLTTARRVVVIALNGVLAGLAVWFVVRPILEHPDPAQPLSTAINLLYILGDLAVVLAASLIMQALARGSMSTPWALVAAGCLMFCGSDLLYAYGVWNGTLGAGPAGPTPILLAYNILFLSAYVTGAVGAYWLARLHGVI